MAKTIFEWTNKDPYSPYYYDLFKITSSKFGLSLKHVSRFSYNWKTFKPAEKDKDYIVPIFLDFLSRFPGVK